MNKLFSLLVPVRKFPKMFEVMVDSVFNTINSPDNVEILVGTDDDDNDITPAIKNVQEKYGADKIIQCNRPRGNSLVDHYFNWLAKNFSTGKYIFAINHDVFFTTKDWDINCYNKLEKFVADKKDRIVYGAVEDYTMKRGKTLLSTSFPIISREAFNILGFVFDPNKYLRWSAEADIAILYHSINRVVDLRPFCTIDHKPFKFKNLEGEIPYSIDFSDWQQKSNFKVWMNEPSISLGYDEKRLKKIKDYINDK